MLCSILITFPSNIMRLTILWTIIYIPTLPYRHILQHIHKVHICTPIHIDSFITPLVILAKYMHSIYTPSPEPITEMLITLKTSTRSFLIYNGQITFHNQSFIFLIKIHLFTNVSNATLHGTNLATPLSTSQPAKLTYATFSFTRL